MKNRFNISLKTLVDFLTLNSKNEPLQLTTEKVNNTSGESLVETKEEYALNKSLKHLEFISQLEINISDQQLRFFSPDFHHELETAKLISKINTVKTASAIAVKAA